jgi:hypothetical protein
MSARKFATFLSLRAASSVAFFQVLASASFVFSAAGFFCLWHCLPSLLPFRRPIVGCWHQSLALMVLLFFMVSLLSVTLSLADQLGCGLKTSKR